MALLTFWPLCWQSPAAKSSGEIQRVPAGWTSTQAGYWLSDTAARDIAAGWSADRESVRVLRQGLADLRSEMAATNADTRKLLGELRKEINNERISYNKKLRATKAQGLLWGVVFGAAAGIIATK